MRSYSSLLTTAALAIACSVGGCSTDGSMAADLGAAAIDMQGLPATRYDYVTNALLLPTNGASTFAIDLDGDNRADNRLRQVLSTFGSILDFQTPQDEAVRVGRGLLILRVESMALQGPIHVQAAAAQGAAAPPRFDGSDVLPLAERGASLSGEIKNGVMDTTNPAMLPPQAEQLTLSVSLGHPTVLTTLHLRGVHVSGRIGLAGILDGQVHGAISAQELNTALIPGLAVGITARIRQDPPSNEAQALIQLLEDQSQPISKAKCAVYADCCARNPFTCTILPDEVRAQPLLGPLLNPDVQVFEGDAWKPVPRGSTRNGFSMGFGFKTVPVQP